MGFLQLLSADSLSATYNTKTHQLILNAQGKAPNYTSGISFQRKPLIGGLLFALEGWVGPRGEGNMSFDITDHFDVELPSKATPSNTIVIKMLDGTKTIPIMFVPPPPPPGAASSNGSNGANTKTPQVPEDKDVGTTDLTVLYKEPFNIVSLLSGGIYLCAELYSCRTPEIPRLLTNLSRPMESVFPQGVPLTCPSTGPSSP